MSKLTIYTGCMCSGKSMLLIRAYRLRPLDTDVYTFGKGDIVSRGGYRTRLTGTQIESLADIKRVKKNVIIDECQFYKSWDIDNVIKLASNYERIYLAGLDWIQLTELLSGERVFVQTNFYKAICSQLYSYPFLYNHYGLLAKNDVTGVLDARISKRYENAVGIINKDNYFNINFKQAFEDKLTLTKK